MGNFQNYLASLVDTWPENQHRGFAFEEHCAAWLKSDPVWASRIQDVYPWKKWAQKTSVDIGTDLVIEMKNGELWSGQCKAYKQDATVKLDNRLGNFLSHSMSPQFSGRVLISTGSSVSRNVESMVKAQEKPLVTVLASDFEESPIDLFSLAFEKKTTPIKFVPKEVRDYQLAAVNEVASEFRRANRTHISMACGTGKTFTSYLVWVEMKPALSVVLVPSIYLLKQTLREWLQFEGFKPKFDWIAVCSDESVENDPDSPSGKLSNFSSPTTTQTQDILRFLKASGQKVIFSTYQSSFRVKEALLQNGGKVDLLFGDEAHRLVGTVKEKSSYLSMVYKSQDLVARAIYMTATPKTLNPGIRKKLENAGLESLSMSDENTFGRRCFTFTFAEAIPRYLSKYQVVAAIVTEAEIAEAVEKRRLYATSDGDLDAQHLGNLVALGSATAEYGLSRLISFHSNLSRAEVFAKSLESGELTGALQERSIPLRATFVSGKQDSETRRQRLALLDSGESKSPVVVTNARCLTEGVDVPSLDGIFFADPKYSEVDIVQALGRVLRASPGKEVGTVVIPLFALEGEDYESQLEEGRWATIWKTIRSLQAHDPTLAARLGLLRSQLGKATDIGGLPEEIHFLGLEKMPSDFAEKIKLTLLRESVDDWYEAFGRFEALAIAEGTARIPPKRGRDGDSIPEGIWAVTQRQNYRAGRLDENQIKLLESFSDWSWDPFTDDFDYALSRCKIAADHFTHYLKIPVDYVDDEGFKVHQWLESIASDNRWPGLEKSRKARIQKEIVGFHPSKREARWLLAAEEAEKWLANGQLPALSSIKVPITEIRLSSWMTKAIQLWREKDLRELEPYEQQRVEYLQNINGWGAYCETRPYTKHRIVSIEEIEGKAAKDGSFHFKFFRCQEECSTHFQRNGDCVVDELKLNPQDLPADETIKIMLIDYLSALVGYSSKFGSTFHPTNKNLMAYEWNGVKLGSRLNQLKGDRVTSSHDSAETVQKVLERVSDPRSNYILNRINGFSDDEYSSEFFNCEGACSKHFGGSSECRSVTIRFTPDKLRINYMTKKSLLNYLDGVSSFSRTHGHCSHPLTKDYKTFVWEGHPLGSTQNRYRSNTPSDIKAEIGPILEMIPGWRWTGK